MKKTTKGAIATGAAVALLLSGGGTLAYWNDSVNAGEKTTIHAGNLKFETPTAPTWTYTPVVGTAQTGLTTAQVAALAINPGDKLTSTGTYNITAQGGGLKFTVGLAGGSISAATTGDTAANGKLATQLQNTAAYKVDGTALAAGTTTATITHTSSTSTNHPVEIAVTLTWPFGTDTANDNASKLGSVSLDQFAVTATQVSS